jgi:hypothetical protein
MNQNFDMKSQVKQILKLVQEVAPGRSVELRIPPYAAIQCVSGSIHRRGMPSNTVEMSAGTLMDLTQNPEKWENFREQGMILASGTHSDLSNLFIEVSKLSQIEDLEPDA